MPHAMAERVNVCGTAIGLSKFPAPVFFDPAVPEKQAQCFLLLAAKDPEQHCQNMSDLSDCLKSEGCKSQCCAVNSV